MFRIFISSIVLIMGTSFHTEVVKSKKQIKTIPTLKNKSLSINKIGNFKNNFNIEIDYESYSFVVLDNGQ